MRVDQRPRALGLGVGVLLSALVSVVVIAAVGGPVAVERVLGVAGGPAGYVAEPGPEGAPPEQPPPLPELAPAGAGAAGAPAGAVTMAGTIEHARFASASLDGEGSFFAYLPPGYASGIRHYPVLYLLHGRDGHADSFLEIGMQAHSTSLIAERAIPPMIAVMIQDRSGLRQLARRGPAPRAPRTWSKYRNSSTACSGRSRIAPTRAIAGSSMGGYGAMNVALANPLRFAVVESWLGLLQRPRRRPRRGPARDLAARPAAPSSTAPPPTPSPCPPRTPNFAAELRSAGAHARGVVYPGGHSLEKVEEHLDTGLLFAGRALQAAQRRASPQAAAARAPRSAT